LSDVVGGMVALAAVADDRRISVASPGLGATAKQSNSDFPVPPSEFRLPPFAPHVL
jgi:hypothetical protein